MVVGPVEPAQPPRLLQAMTKNLSVSIGLPGPMQLSHQPGRLSSGLCQPAAWWSPDSAWQTRMALLRVVFSVP